MMAAASQKTIYETIATLKMEIESLELLLESHERELAIVLKREGPGTVKAMQYDGVPGVKLIRPSDDYIDEITSLNAKIDNDKARLEAKKADLRQYLSKMKGWSKRLTGLELQIFQLQFTGDKPMTNEETAKVLGYSIGHIKNIKVKIYRKMEDTSS
jgi:DNA-directed RNA polymerase specialized sigma subunit